MTGVAESVLPLAIDTFAIGAGVGLVTEQSSRLVRTGLLLVGAAFAAPLLGLAVPPAVRSLAARADTVAIPLLFAVAVWALTGSERKWTSAPTPLVALLGVGATMNAVRVGSVELRQLPLVPVIVEVVVQVAIVTTLGLGAGQLAAHWSREAGAKLAGLAIAAGGAGALLLGMHLGTS